MEKTEKELREDKLFQKALKNRKLEDFKSRVFGWGVVILLLTGALTWVLLIIGLILAFIK